MVARPHLVPIDALPVDISELLEPSRVEGHDLVRRLVVDWEDGSNRFDQPGEIAVTARLANRLVAVGGLNRDPYLDDPIVARIRHVYVAPPARGVGVGRALVMALVDHARLGFDRVRLRTTRPEASEFYVALGFDLTSGEPDATHEIRF